MPSALAALARSRPAREAAVFLGFCPLTAVMTWPRAANMEDASADTGDPYMIAWALWWDYRQTFADPLNLFHANVFYPYRYTPAFGGNDYGIALLLFPLFAAGARTPTAHSVATSLGFAFCGYGAFRLARTPAGSRGAARVAGFVYAFITFRFESRAHLRYLFAGWMPLRLEALYRPRLAERGRVPRYEESMRDVAEVGRGLFPAGEGGARDFAGRLRRPARASVEGAEGRALHGGLGDARFVARLYENAGLEPDVAAAEALVASLASGAETRAGALVRVAQDPRPVERERRRSPPVLHYFGFLRRDPDDPPDHDLEGFNFWLAQLERTRDHDRLALAFRDPFEYKRIKGE